MTRSDEQRLADITEAADQIAELVARGRSAYETDIAIRLALERLLEIIGEAANSLSAPTQELHPDVKWQDVTRLRIVLAHHYHRVDPELVWQFATSDVPILAESLSAT